MKTTMESEKLRKVPVRSRARKVILWVHLWLSLLVGVFILAIALSGVALVFRDETDRYLFESELYSETPGTTATIEDAHSVVQEAYPDLRVEFIKSPEIAGGVYEARLAGEDETFLHAATVDPGTGELLGTRGDPYKEGFNGFMFDLHVFLLSGKIGLTDEVGIKIVGAVGIVLFVVLVTGVYLWWPGLRRWAVGFKVRFRRDRYIRNYDYHKVVGIVAVPILALITVTGFSMSFHETAGHVWYAATFTEPPPEYPEKPPTVEQPAEASRLSLDEVANRAGAETGATPTRIHPPIDETGTAQVALSTPYDPQAGYDGVDGNRRATT